mmetsp:Transcript_70415/g.205968  ORF Transcript_70415/g.205968 Transcript_70415/m.205968 type:complete len:144 (-) Transcript_70415:31-462(-)
MSMILFCAAFQEGHMGLQYLLGTVGLAALGCWWWCLSQRDAGLASAVVLAACLVLSGCAVSKRVLLRTVQALIVMAALPDEARDFAHDSVQKYKDAKVASERRKQAERLAAERELRDASDPALKCRAACRRPAIMAAALERVA